MGFMFELIKSDFQQLISSSLCWTSTNEIRIGGGSNPHFQHLWERKFLILQVKDELKKDLNQTLYQYGSDDKKGVTEAYDLLQEKVC